MKQLSGQTPDVTEDQQPVERTSTEHLTSRDAEVQQHV